MTFTREAAGEQDPKPVINSEEFPVIGRTNPASPPTSAGGVSVLTSARNARAAATGAGSEARVTWLPVTRGAGIGRQPKALAS